MLYTGEKSRSKCCVRVYEELSFVLIEQQWALGIHPA
jgi:hypothetical protein